MCVCHSPKFVPNLNCHNSVNFENTTSRFCLVVDLKEEVEEENDDKDDNNNNIVCLFLHFKIAEQSEANPYGAARFANHH